MAPLLSVAPSHALALASAVSQRTGVALLLYCWLHLLDTITSEPPHTRSEYQPATVRHLTALESLPKLVLVAAITFVWRGANLLPIAGQSMTNVPHMSGGDARTVAPLSGRQLAGGWRPAWAAPEDTHARNMQLVSASLWALFTVWLGFLSARLLNHRRSMNCERDIRFELLARLCPNTTGADIRSVCIEAGMFAIRARRKTVSEKDMIDAVNKVVKGYSKFSATPKYLVYN